MTEIERKLPKLENSINYATASADRAVIMVGELEIRMRHLAEEVKRHIQEGGHQNHG